MSVAAEELVERIRAAIGHKPGMVEKKMFGGFCFMLNGNMVAGAMKGGELLVRVGPNQQEAALRRPGAELMRMGERTMTGFITVTDEGIESEEALRDWLDFAESYVKTMPPK